MSAHRDLKAAQQALNEAVGDMLARYSWNEFTTIASYIDCTHLRAIRSTYQELERQQAILEAPGGSSGRFTSINAAHANLPRKGTLRWNILLCVVAQQAQFGTGMTVAELKARLKKEHSSVSSAINALYERDWLRDSGDKRLTQHGEPAIVWAPTEKAIAKCREVALEVNDGS